jgi:DNA adenine methylase
MSDEQDFGALEPQRDTRRPGQLLKWVGNKYQDAPTIIEHFPYKYDTYYEPFLGTGGVLGNLNPPEAITGDTLEPLIDLWRLVKSDPRRAVSS